MRAWTCMLAICAGSVSVAETRLSGLQSEAVPVGSANCSDLAVKTRGARLRRALEGGFGVQYWGEGYSADSLAAQPHGLLIIEVAKVGAQYSDTGREMFFSVDEMNRISRDGARPVLSYLNVGEIETYRDYWIEALAEIGSAETGSLPIWYGPHYGQDDRLAAYWMPQWHDLLLARVDRLMQSGASGVFLDDVLQYFSHAAETGLDWPSGTRPEGPRTAPELARAMMRLVTRIAERVRAWDCEALVVVNNAAFIGRDAAEGAEGDGSSPGFDAYRAAIDAIMAENALVSPEHATTRTVLTEDYLDAGIPVLTLDVLPDHGAEDWADRRQELAARAIDAGFAPYLVDDAIFNRLAAPVLLPGKS